MVGIFFRRLGGHFMRFFLRLEMRNDTTGFVTECITKPMHRVERWRVQECQLGTNLGGWRFESQTRGSQVSYRNCCSSAMPRGSKYWREGYDSEPAY